MIAMMLVGRDGGGALWTYLCSNSHTYAMAHSEKGAWMQWRECTGAG